MEREYKRSAKEREKLSSTYIGGGIAIPHGEVKWIKQSVLAIARMRAPIDWGGDKVEFVMMIAIRPQESEQLKRLFQELAHLSEDEEMLERWKHTKTAQQFYQCL
ncbi:PTS system mannose-specific EIIBCA component [Anoxybacillus sp. BCO1]|nr:PTS system mannose-specific EIIBCA component [Anoxybacillus sp. BCO1]